MHISPAGRLARTVVHAVSAAFMALCLSLMAPVMAQNDTPTQTVETVVDNVLSILRSDDYDFDQALPLIREEIKRAFDDVAMAQSVLSTNWRSASEAQQEEFIDLLAKTIENTYIDRMRTYSYGGETVEFRDETISGSRASVSTVVVTENNNIPIVYQLRKRSDGWFVYDVEVENVSMVSTYRETYRSIVRRDGMSGLLQQMRDKLEELQASEAG